MEWWQIALGGLITGGGLVALINAAANRPKVEAEAESAIADAYEKLSNAAVKISDAADRIADTSAKRVDRFAERIASQDEKIAELTDTVYKLRNDIISKDAEIWSSGGTGPISLTRRRPGYSVLMENFTVLLLFCGLLAPRNVGCGYKTTDRKSVV